MEEVAQRHMGRGWGEEVCLANRIRIPSFATYRVLLQGFLNLEFPFQPPVLLLSPHSPPTTFSYLVEIFCPFEV